MGKTALLDQARTMASDKMEVLHARATPMETGVAFALVRRLLAPFEAVARPTSWATWDPRHLRAARFNQVRAELWSRAQVAGLALVVDDLQWADRDSLELVSFLARRLHSLPVSIVGALRPWPPGAAELLASLASQEAVQMVHLDPLSAMGTGQLLAEAVGGTVGSPALGVGMVERAWEMTGGNPWLVLEAGRWIRENGDLPDPAGAELGEIQQALLLSHLVDLPPGAISCARAAAVLGGPFRLGVLQAVAAQPDGAFAEAFDSLVKAGVVHETRGGMMAFSHDLLAGAIQHDLDPDLRRLLHRRAFELYAGWADMDKAAAHALGAGLVGDPRAVEVLTAAGERALRNGAVRNGVSQLAAAVEVAGPHPPTELLGRYADALLAADRPVEALAVLETLTAALDESSRVDLAVKRARAQAYTGQLDSSIETYQELARTMAAQRAGRTQMLAERAHVVWERDGPAATLDALEDGSWPVEEPKLRDALRGFFGMQMGDPSGLGDMERAATVARWQLSSGDSGAMVSFNVFVLHATALAVAERFDQAHELIDFAIDGLRRRNGPWSTIGLRIARMAILLNQGRCLELLAEADDLDDELDVDLLNQPRVLIFRAQALASLGRLSEAAARCDQAESLPGTKSWFARLSLSVARGQLHLAAGRPHAAVQAYLDVEPLVERVGVGSLGSPPWATGMVEAALAADRLDDVLRVVEWLERRAATMPCAWPRAIALGGRAGWAEAVGDQGQADDLYRQALSFVVANPLDRAQVMLRHGSWLRRQGQDRRARPVLAEANRLAEAWGAQVLADRARAELAAAGGRRRRRSDPTALSSQEATVAEMAANGDTVAEMARAMHISPRTVESHLASVYRKLGVHSKVELRRLRTEDAVPAT